MSDGGVEGGHGAPPPNKGTISGTQTAGHLAQKLGGKRERVGAPRRVERLCVSADRGQPLEQVAHTPATWRIHHETRPRGAGDTSQDASTWHL